MKPFPRIPGKTGHYKHDCILEGMADVSAASKGLTDAGLVVLIVPHSFTSLAPRKTQMDHGERYSSTTNLTHQLQRA